MDTTTVMDPGTGGARVIDGRYRIVRPLARGGMSEVAEAWDERLHRHVAIKLLSPAIAGDAASADRFEREARAIAGLSHPGIVAVYDHGRTPVPYIVMELIEGPTLKEMAAGRAPFAEAEASGIAEQILDALDHAHRRGIVHRDVKPQNVLVAPDGRMKLADFGIARSLEATSALTQTGQIVGTAAYLSPEQAVGQPATAASDIYSTGVLLFELLTGSLPFAADNALAIARLHVEAPPPDPRALRPDISPSMAGAVLRALAKRPEDRFPDAASMAAAVRAGTGDHGATAPLAVHRRVRAGGMGSRRLAVLAVAALLLLGGVIAATWPGGGSGPGAGTTAARSQSAPARIRIPAVVGEPYPQARARLLQAGFMVGRKLGPFADAPRNTVLSATPSGSAAKGAKVTLVVSSGPAPPPAPAPAAPPKHHKPPGGDDKKHGHGKKHRDH